MRTLLLTTALCVPTALFAVGTETPAEETAPPEPTEAEAACLDQEMVLSEDGETCVEPEEGEMKEEALYDAARKAAYLAQYGAALKILAVMPDQMDDRVLTYKGFVARKTGDLKLGEAYYQQAIARNPDNLLARSYMGQGLVEAGDIDAARDQLIEIRLRGGKDSWAEVALAKAILTGATYNY